MDDNYIQPFQLDESNLRGRAVRLGDELDKILTAHDYPKPVSHLTAESLILTLLLSSMLKYDGVFTLQTSGDGAVGMLVSDLISNGAMRACAHFDQNRLQASRESLSALKAPEGSENHLAQYLGKGHMAFTVDYAGAKDRYQGIVALEGASLVDCVQHYFSQSEQIQTGIKIAVGKRDGKWRGAAIMLQAMPENDGNTDGVERSNIHEDDWRRAMLLMGSCTEDELLSPELSTNDLLYRLFHEEGVRVFEGQSVYKKCRCTEERVNNIIKALTEEEKKDLLVNEKIEVTCEFCGHLYQVDP